MCRSVLEHPPAGLRCDKKDHLSPEAKERKRLARNARERELYRLRKNRGQGAQQEPLNLATVPLETSVPREQYEKARKSLQEASQNQGRLGAHLTWNQNISTPEQREQLAQLLQSEQSDLAYMEITDEDEDFNEYQETTNQVFRVTLKDGSVGYFKNYESGHLVDEGYSTNDYGHTFLGAALNEVAAYRLAQVMGEGYNTLVPETVFREYNGLLGTIQKEAPGEVRKYHGENMKHMSKETLDMSNLRKAAIYDFISGAQDRHAGNYLVDDETKPYTIKLIDNGFGFYAGNGFVGSQGIIRTYLYIAGLNFTPTEEERKTFQELHDSPDLKGIAPLIGEQAADILRLRIRRLFRADYLDPQELFKDKDY